MPTPAKPALDVREKLLAVLGELVVRGGAAQLMLPPVAPGEEAFPEPWAPTKVGAQLLLRRLLWHAGIDRDVLIDDRRAAAAPPTERKPSTRIELVEVRGKQACFALGFIGDDDIVGTLAHEVGTLHALLNRPDDADPYRSAEAPVLVVDSDRDPERGAVATVYLGLGVLAANAAYQQYSTSGRFNGGYVPLEYDVLRAGAAPMSSVAFLLAVQAVVRHDDDLSTIEPPDGLGPPQRDEVAGWIRELAEMRAELCERLGIDAASRSDASTRGRETPVAFADTELVAEPVPQKIAFRWQTNRGGVGLIAGTVLGMGLAFIVSRGMLPFTAFGGATAGHLIGRRIRAPRCSACATVVREGATTCPSCGAALRGDIARLSDRLEAEEQLEQSSSQ